ncbi:winged helix-turn-helix transcriptional regulator [Cohnella nanjingensis]|uniref:Winged helix-turn-helix transcriptional regulator n=2 Tax=Cohnella nanjingensis TaxID=1387779 RepID=A0A7X0RTV6_9BACL|nr:winged helix-turn-helix transcriptional regulator [Cohnella nanjingensis]
MQFKPLHELICSLHTYICRKSYKKIDLGLVWAKETQQRLKPELADLLDHSEIDYAWKLTYLLVHLCPEEDGAGFLGWLEGMSAGDLYELLAPYTHQFPESLGAFRSRTLTIFSQWQEQYFRDMDPAILEALREEDRDRRREQPTMKPEAFVDRTTNGLVFEPAPGMERLVLIPQYHFQPVNVIYSFGNTTICHYAARIYLGEEDFLSTHAYRMIRSLAEKSRLKILRYLHQGPRSFIEIFRHLQLSKGITHDHITKLRMAGMIRAHFEGESLTVYSLREGALEQMQRSLTAYIHQG